MNVLVTGGSGFLGSAIAEKLSNRGDRVTVLCRRDMPFFEEKGIIVVKGDITDRDSLEPSFSQQSAVIHSAAKVGVWGPYREFYKTNVQGTINIIDACRSNNIPKLVFTSSPSVAYGRKGAEGIDESQPYPETYDSFYSETKAEAERLILKTNDTALATCVLRPHLIWGPNDPHLVKRIVERARSGRLKIVGSGSNLIDTTYIDNAAQAHLLALDALSPEAACAGKAYFISQGEPLPVIEIINRIVMAAGLPPVNTHISVGVAATIGGILETVYRLLRKKNEPLMTRFLAYQLSAAHWFDITAARKDLGYSPSISIDQGMQLLANWFSQPK